MKLFLMMMVCLPVCVQLSTSANAAEETPFKVLEAGYQALSSPATVADFTEAWYNDRDCVLVSAAFPKEFEEFQIEAVKYQVGQVNEHGPLFPGKNGTAESTIAFGPKEAFSTIVSRFARFFAVTSSATDLQISYAFTSAAVHEIFIRRNSQRQLYFKSLRQGKVDGYGYCWQH